MTSAEVHFFIDDTGSRDPDRVPTVKRDDGMNCFALGGVLVNAEDVEAIKEAHTAFCAKHNINYPLHSWAIRGGRGNFGWLRKNPERTAQFYSDVGDFLVSLPLLGIAAVVHRPGYVARYKDKYQDNLWFMCKTAYSILVERAAKYAQRNGRTLRIFYEETGLNEDRDLVAYTKALKSDGMPFSQNNSAPYAGLSPEDFRRIILGDPIRKTKKTRLIQIADLMLYPMVKGRYAPDYRPYRQLMDAGKIIDALLDKNDVNSLGVKYSCFDGLK
jgi:Protein of unknown function (DUF3800)